RLVLPRVAQPLRPLRRAGPEGDPMPLFGQEFGDGRPPAAGPDDADLLAHHRRPACGATRSPKRNSSPLIRRLTLDRWRTIAASAMPATAAITGTGAPNTHVRTGYVTAAAIDATEIYRVATRTSTHTTTKSAAIRRSSAIAVPKAVAIPFPP